jgi:hypothetical protein
MEEALRLLGDGEGLRLLEHNIHGQQQDGVRHWHGAIEETANIRGRESQPFGSLVGAAELGDYLLENSLPDRNSDHACSLITTGRALRSVTYIRRTPSGLDHLRFFRGFLRLRLLDVRMRWRVQHAPQHVIGRRILAFRLVWHLESCKQ